MVNISRERNLATTIIASIFTVCLIVYFNSIGTIAYGNLTESDATVAEKYISMEEAPTTRKSGAIAEVVDVQINDNQAIRVGVTDSAISANYTNLKTDAELSVTESTGDRDLEVKSIIDSIDEAKAEIEAEAEAARIAAENEAIIKAMDALGQRKYTTSKTQGGLLDIASPDPNYVGTAIRVTGADRDILERLVMGEAGNQGFEGAALVAQAIRDMYITGGFTSVDAVRRNCGYSGKLDKTPNQDVLDAVSYIFDIGGYAVKHRVLYFYSPSNMRTGTSSFHESQNHILTYGGHKFFDRWY